MGSAAIQIATAGIAVIGTLAGALFTQLLSRRAERERRREEDSARWLQEHLRVNSNLIGKSMSIERELWSVCSFLERTPSDDRNLGFTSIFTSPEEGIPGALDVDARDILIEKLFEVHEGLSEVEGIVAEVTLIGSPDEAVIAHALQEALWDAAGYIESYSALDTAADAVHKCRDLRIRFTTSVRRGLRVSGEVDLRRLPEIEDSNDQPDN